MSEGINVSIETLKSVYDEIAELDETIGAAVGGKSAGKRALANQLATGQEENVTNLFEVFTENLGGLGPDEIAGIITGIRSKINEAYNETIEAYLESQIGESPEVTPEILDAADKAREIRKDKVKGFKTLRQLLEMFGTDTSSVGEPRKWTGGTGPRTFSTYQYTVNGSALPDAENSLATVAKMGGFEKSTRTSRKGEEIGVSASANLKAFLGTIEGFDVKNPADTWEATLPNGTVVQAVKQDTTVDSVYVDDSDDDDSDEDDD